MTRFGFYVITVELPGGYQPGAAVDWEERRGDQLGTGSLGDGEGLSDHAWWGTTGFGLGGLGDTSAAIFVRVTSSEPGNPTVRYGKVFGPVAVL